MADLYLGLLDENGVEFKTGQYNRAPMSWGDFATDMRGERMAMVNKRSVSFGKPRGMEGVTGVSFFRAANSTTPFSSGRVTYTPESEADGLVFVPGALKVFLFNQPLDV